jgi:hypothetical protein
MQGLVSKNVPHLGETKASLLAGYVSHNAEGILCFGQVRQFPVDFHFSSSINGIAFLGHWIYGGWLFPIDAFICQVLTPNFGKANLVHEN